MSDVSELAKVSQVSLRGCQYLTGATFENRRIVRHPGQFVDLAMSAWGVVAFVGQVKFFAAGRDSMRAIKVGGLGVATSRRGLFLPVVERWSSVIVERIDTDTVIFKVPDRVIDETWAVIRPAVEAMGFPAG